MYLSFKKKLLLITFFQAQIIFASLDEPELSRFWDTLTSPKQPTTLTSPQRITSPSETPKTITTSPTPSWTKYFDMYITIIKNCSTEKALDNSKGLITTLTEMNKSPINLKTEEECIYHYNEMRNYYSELNRSLRKEQKLILQTLETKEKKDEFNENFRIHALKIYKLKEQSLANLLANKHRIKNSGIIESKQ